MNQNVFYENKIEWLSSLDTIGQRILCTVLISDKNSIHWGKKHACKSWFKNRQITPSNANHLKKNNIGSKRIVAGMFFPLYLSIPVILWKGRHHDVVFIWIKRYDKINLFWHTGTSSGPINQGHVFLALTKFPENLSVWYKTLNPR